MRIVISLLSLKTHETGGVETYLRELLAQMPSVCRNDDVHLLLHRDLAPEFAHTELPATVVDLSAREVYLQRALEAFGPFRARHIERKLAELQPDVVLFPQQVVFPKATPFTSVVVVHDLAELFYPQYFSWHEHAYRRAMHRFSVNRADRLIAVSGFTAQTLTAKYGVPPDRIETVPHGMQRLAIDEAATESHGLTNYIYYPASSHPHKNHQGLLQTVAQLKAQGRFPYQLVLTGVRTHHWRVVAQLIRKLGLDDVVVDLGYVHSSTVGALYRDAEAVVFPTFFEGFGLPVLEAASFGKKVIVSRLQVFAEQGVPEAYRIDFSEPEQLHRALALPVPQLLNASPQTWHSCATATLEVLRRTVGHKCLTLPIAQLRKAA